LTGGRAQPRIVRENGRIRVVADVGADGLDVARPFPNLKRAALNRRSIGEHLEVRELAGQRPRESRPGSCRRTRGRRAGPALISIISWARANRP
jgi:hypothetical protein